MAVANGFHPYQEEEEEPATHLIIHWKFDLFNIQYFCRQQIQILGKSKKQKSKYLIETSKWNFFQKKKTQENESKNYRRRTSSEKIRKKKKTSPLLLSLHRSLMNVYRLAQCKSKEWIRERQTGVFSHSLVREYFMMDVWRWNGKKKSWTSKRWTARIVQLLVSLRMCCCCYQSPVAFE